MQVDSKKWLKNVKISVSLFIKDYTNKIKISKMN